MNGGVSLRFISMLKLNKNMRKRSKLHIIMIMSKDDKMSIEQ